MVILITVTIETFFIYSIFFLYQLKEEGHKTDKINEVDYKIPNQKIKKIRYERWIMMDLKVN